MKRNITLVILLALVYFVGLQPASAFPNYDQAMSTTYGTPLNSCAICHINGANAGPRTDYGLLFEAVPTHASDPVGALCSIGAPAGATTNNCPVQNGTIAGNVINISSGLPISGATVTADGQSNDTDASGNYIISIGAGTYTLTASATGYQTGTEDNVVVTSGNVTTRDFALTPIVVVIVNGTIAGTVTNASDGSPISGATVTADGQSNVTDAAGNYSIDIAPGTYTVTASATGYQTGTANGVIVTSGNVTTRDFALTPLPVTPPAQTFTISGFKLRSTDDTGVPDWPIILTNDTINTTVTTDATGMYQFTGLSNGTYNVTEGTMTGWTPVGETTLSVTIAGADVQNVNFINTPPVTPPAQTFTISGFKLRSTDNTGVPDWPITLTNDTMNISVTTDATGMYQFAGLSNGAYDVTEGTMTGWTPVGATTLSVTIAGADVTNKNFTNTPPVTPPPTEMGSISGLKINDLNGNGEQDSGEDGLSGWTIELRGIGPETHKIKEETTTDANGFYKFDDLPAGKYIVKEKHMKGFIPVSPPVIVVSLEKGMDSTDNNFMNRPISSLTNRRDDNTE